MGYAIGLHTWAIIINYLSGCTTIAALMSQETLIDIIKNYASHIEIAIKIFGSINLLRPIYGCEKTGKPAN